MTMMPPQPPPTEDTTQRSATQECFCCGHVIELPSARRLALSLSLYFNIAITLAKLFAYIQTTSLSVLAALLDSVLDVVSQVVLNYTEKHSSMQRSSALYPAGASRLEPIGVLTCAALMGMASFEVVKESIVTLVDPDQHTVAPHFASVYSMGAIVLIKLGLLWLCNVGAYKQQELGFSKHAAFDPTLEALAQDHWNDALSNTVAAAALLVTLKRPALWYLDAVGAILISMYIIYSWYSTGVEQIEQLTGKSAPEEFIQELVQIADAFDDRIAFVDTVRAYHFGPKFLVEIEIVMDAHTLLSESHDLGMDLQYEIEGKDEVERCFVHIDYQARAYDEHVVSKVPELREFYLKQSRSHRNFRSTQSV